MISVKYFRFKITKGILDLKLLENESCNIESILNVILLKFDIITDIKTLTA